MRKNGKNNKQSRRPRRTLKSGDSGALEKFRFINATTFTWTATNTTINVPVIQGASAAATFGVRVNSLMLLWEMYRVTKLRVIISPDQNTVPNQFLFAYAPAIAGVVDTTTLAALAEKGCTHIHSSSLAQPSSFIVPRRLLISTADKWFATSAAGSLNELIQGHIYCKPFVATTQTLCVTFEFEVAFRGMTIASADLLISKMETDLIIKELKRRASEKLLSDSGLTIA